MLCTCYAAINYEHCVTDIAMKCTYFAIHASTKFADYISNMQIT